MTASPSWGDLDLSAVCCLCCSLRLYLCLSVYFMIFPTMCAFYRHSHYVLAIGPLTASYFTGFVAIL